MQRVTVLLMVLGFVIGCNQSESDKATDEQSVEQSELSGTFVINGVGRSELALTMRNMYDQMKLVRNSIERGVEIKSNYLEKYRSIHSDRATEPEKIDETYQAMAALFLKQYKAFESDSTNRITAFNSMLDGCLACHQQKCPGPIKVINKLKLTESRL
jgi:hypothetical protein